MGLTCTIMFWYTDVVVVEMWRKLKEVDYSFSTYNDKKKNPFYANQHNNQVKMVRFCFFFHLD